MKIVFMGTPDFAVKILQSLIDSPYEVVGVVTQPDKLVGRKKVLTPPPVKQLASKHGIPVFQPEKIRADYQPILAWKPDLIVTCAYGQILPKALLDLPRFGAINVHASLLPKYRGGAPIQWAIMNGEQETGITIMYMAEKMDAGDLIAQVSTPILPSDDVGTLHERLSELGAKLLLETLPLIFAGSNQRIKQDEALVTYAYNISPEDERINWQKPGEAIWNQIRALSPWPGAYTTYAGQRFKIYAAELVQKSQGEAGEIIAIEKDGIVAMTGDGMGIKILVGQLEGRKQQPLKEILNGNHPFKIEAKFN